MAFLAYGGLEKQVIVRFMPWPVHDVAGIEFNSRIRDTILEMPGHSRYSLRGVATTRFHVPGTEGFKSATRTGQDNWPSLVIEA